MKQIIINVISNDRTTSHLEDLKQGRIHVIAFAEAGMSNFRANLEFAANMSMDDANDICDLINKKNETCTMHPVLNMTGIPKKFVREVIDTNDSYKIASYEKCIKDCFLANQMYIKSKHMVFEFTCCAKNTDILESIIRKIINEDYCTEYLQLVELFVD